MAARTFVLGTVASVIAVIAVALPAVASGAPVAATEFCYTTLLSDAALKAGAKNTVSCYRSEQQLDLAVATNVSLTNTLTQSSVQTLSFTSRRLARHYDGSSGIGSNLSVYGTSCSGGGLNLTGTGWDDRIGSTMHGACGTIVHYSGAGYSGFSELTVGACGIVVSLGGLLANNVSSIRYFTPETSWCSI